MHPRFPTPKRLITLADVEGLLARLSAPSTQVSAVYGGDQPILKLHQTSGDLYTDIVNETAAGVFWGISAGLEGYAAYEGSGPTTGYAIGREQADTDFNFYVQTFGDGHGWVKAATFLTADQTFHLLKALHIAAKALTDAATIAVNCDDGNMQNVAVAGNRTMGAPTGTPTDGQTLRLRVKNTGTFTLAWNAIYRFPGGTAPVLTATTGKTDYFDYVYNAADTKWDLVGKSQNL